VSSLWTSGNDSLYYTASNVGIGTNTAEYKLDVHGNANVGALTVTTISGDGAGLSNIQTSNVIGLTDNVNRIETLETDLSDNVNRIETLETDLSDNSSRIGSIESGDITITGVKTFQDDIILESSLDINGTLSVGSNIVMDDTASNVIEVSGNMKTDSLFLGNFELVASQGLSHVTAVSAVTNDTVYLNNQTTGLVVDSNVEVGGNLTVEGDVDFNGNLTMNTITVQTLFTLDHVVSQGNTTSNTVQFQNATTALTATGNVEVGGELSVSGDATVSGNVGIGTSEPVTALEVYSTTGTQLTLSSDSRYSTIYGVDDTGSCFFGNDGGDFRITTGGNTSGTGASEAMRVDSSGYIKQNLMPRFLAYYPDDSNYTDLTAGAIIIMSTTAFNVGSGYDTSTGYFTAPVDGYYAFHFGIYCSTNGNRRLDLMFKETSSSTAVKYNVHQHVAGNVSGGFENSITAYGYVGYSNMANFSFITKMVAGNQLAVSTASDLRTYHYRSHISGHMISAA